jgi:cell wall-associated NlpC family hydrolase
MKQKNDMNMNLQQWLGAPYRHRGRSSAGVDCVSFVADRLSDLIGVPYAKLPEYALDEMKHTADERLLHFFITNFGAYYVLPPAQNGDICFYNLYGKGSCHCGIFCDGKIYHAVYGIGVIASRFTEKKWRKRLTHIMRVEHVAVEK